MFRSTSGSIVTNRCQEGKRIHSTNPHPVIFHDCLTPVAAENLSTLSLKEPVVIEGINPAIFLTQNNFEINIKILTGVLQSGPLVDSSSSPHPQICFGNIASLICLLGIKNNRPVTP